MTSIARWGGTSRYADVDGPVHYVDFGGDGPTMVMVHGLGGSHLDWSLLAPRLTGSFRIVAPDLLGYGLTKPDHRVSSVPANTELLNAFIAEVADGPVTLVGNSMGGLITSRQAAARPDTVSELVLIDPVLPLPRSQPHVALAMLLGRFALPRLGRTILALNQRGRTTRQMVQTTFKRCCVDPTRVPDSLITALVELIELRTELPGADDAFLASAQSLLDSNGRGAWASLRDITTPVLLIHGEQDRLVPAVSAREAARRIPQWTVDVLPGLGHLPQIEAPDRVASRILSWSATPARPPRGC